MIIHGLHTVALLPPEYQEFDHYTPAVYLVENGRYLRWNTPGYEEALSRFERLFADLNELLPKSGE